MENVLNSPEWNQCLGVIKKFTVKIETPTCWGTGFFVFHSKLNDIPIVNIATAHHVVSHACEWREPIKLTCLETNASIFLNPNDQGHNFSILNDPAHDISLIKYNANLLRFDETNVPIFPPSKYLIYAGVEIGWCGFPIIAPNNLCFFNGYISSHYNQDGDYLVDGTVINGVSGGPVFSRANGVTFIIGLVSAYFPNQQIGATTPGLCLMRNITPIVDTIAQSNTMNLPPPNNDEKDKRPDA
jgi:hypothetical protein